METSAIIGIVTDIMNLALAVAAVYLGYKVCVARGRGAAMETIRKERNGLIACVALLWLLNIYTGFIR